MSTRFLAIACVMLLPATAMAQEPQPFERRTPHTLKGPADFKGPRVTLADFAWFEGNWAGTGLGGNCDETWSRPAGGAMMGMFRYLKGDAVVFYEFLTLVEQDNTVVLKLKHFNPDLTGWEEKGDFVTFRLLTLTPTDAFFDGLTFTRVGSDGMRIFLALRDRATSAVREEEFVYTRK